MDSMTSGQLAAAAGVGIEALRFYERQGLLPAPPRTEAGYRQYPASMAARIRFLRKAQRLGFSLREIAELLDLREKSGRSCRDVRLLALRKVKEVESKIVELQQVRKALKRLVGVCLKGQDMGDCPIVDYLEGS